MGVRHPDYFPAEDYSVLEKLKETGTTVVDFTLMKREVTGVELVSFRSSPLVGSGGACGAPDQRTIGSLRWFSWSLE